MDIEAVRSLLIEDEVDVNAAQGDGMTALHWAAFQDDVEMAKLLIAAEAKRQGEDPHWRDYASGPGFQER